MRRPPMLWIGFADPRGDACDERQDRQLGPRAADFQEVAGACPFGLADTDIADDDFRSEGEEFRAR